MAPRFALVLFSFVGAAANPAPIVIVPGDGSNQLEAKLDKPSTVSWRCSKTSGWFRLWLDISNLLLSTSCWADNIKLIYDENADTLSNNLGVTTRVPHWGSTEGFEQLDPAVPFSGTGVFNKMVKAFTDAGHVKNQTLRGAPYDFRYAPSSTVGAEYTDALKALIEETYTAQGNTRVTLISHSMGCLQVHYLLTHQSQEWKDTYIERWVPIAGPFGGSAQIWRLHASGNNEGLPVSSLSVREEQRSYETNFWLAPVPQWFGEQVLVETASRNYTTSDYDDFFADIGYAAGSRLLGRVSGLTAGAEAPGVDVLCLYSLGEDTPVTFKYTGSFDDTPEIVNGDGDGTVNDLSLKLCDRWAEAGAQSRTARVKRFSGITHSNMVSDESVISALMTELGLQSQIRESEYV